MQTLITRRTVNRIVLAWVSDASGDASVNTDSLSGVVERVCFIPDAGGTQPSDQYDVTVDDIDGIDIIAGQGGNLSNTAASQLLPDPGVAIDGALSVVVANAGDSNGGTVVLYVRWQ